MSLAEKFMRSPDINEAMLNKKYRETGKLYYSFGLARFGAVLKSQYVLQFLDFEPSHVL